MEKEKFCFYTDTSNLYDNISVNKSAVYTLEIPWSPHLFQTGCIAIIFEPGTSRTDNFKPQLVDGRF